LETKQLISIVTPCYNEEANVENHYQRVCKAIEPFRSKYEFEHIYTDNCSLDSTFERLVEMSKTYPKVRVLRFSRNIGADRAIYFGLQHSRGDAIMLIQADLQDPPELIPDFIRGWEEGYEVIYGKVSVRKEGPILRTGRRIYYKIISSLSDVPIPQNAGEFRLTSRRALDSLLQYKENDLYMRGAVAEVGYKQKPLLYVRTERAAGKSSVNLAYLFSYAINGLLSTTVVPIRAVTLCGIAVSAIGFFLTAYMIVGKLIFPGAQPHGFTTIASMITFFSGAQMLAIGIIGEYLRKTYVQSLQRPRGFIQDKVNFE
jgi:polyisoprenyl-phosphate glycosyltransferase